MELNFDMDGTIVNFYGVDGWLQYLQNEDATPYEVAAPLVNCNLLARRLNELQRRGYTLNIVSWGSKSGSDKFLEEVRIAKLKWLSKHLKSVKWDSVNIVSYGTPKSTFKQTSISMLFDDEERNLVEWGANAIPANDMMDTLKGFLL